MVEIIERATRVATPLALLGLVAALAYFAYNRRLRHREKALESLPEHERARITDEYLTRYGIDGSKLRLADKFALIRDEMQKRHQRSLSYVIVSAVVFVVCFALAVFAYVSKSNPIPEPPGTEQFTADGNNDGDLNHAGSYLTRKDPDFSGVDRVIPYFGDLVAHATGQFLCSDPVSWERTDPTVTVSGVRSVELGPTVEAYLFSPRGQPELQLHESTRQIREGVATLKFSGTLPARGLVFIVCWYDGADTEPDLSTLSITLQ